MIEQSGVTTRCLGQLGQSREPPAEASNPSKDDAPMCPASSSQSAPTIPILGASRGLGHAMAAELLGEVSTEEFVRGMVTNGLSPVRAIEALQDLQARWLPFGLIPHRHRPRAELQPAHELQVDRLR
jgi:hypothetical protein